MKTLLLTYALAVTPLIAGEWTVGKDGKGMAVKINGQLFTRYLIKYQNKPVLYPLIGPTGKSMTRGLGEGDHQHHTSFWLTHGNVSGTDHWSRQGEIKHLEFVKTAGGKQAVITTRNAWLDKAGKLLGHDTRTLTIGAKGETRWVDFDITVTANEPMIFGRTKEGMFGVRVNPAMTVPKGGQIINSNGDKDREAWGKRAAWVDYHGKIEGERVGILILQHPTSFRFPGPWHVRTYGLFAANPFLNLPPHTVAPSKTIHFRYRVILTPGGGNLKANQATFERYAKE